MKRYIDINVLEAAKQRISMSFDSFDKLYISFSGGKDSTVMLHLVMDEAIKRGRKVGVLIIDLEAQYSDTITHIKECVNMYSEYIDLHWICAELLLRNAVSNFQPKWCCWEKEKQDVWVRELPREASDLSQYDFYRPKMEFEEFMVLFGEWYSPGENVGAFIGIRSDESLHRYRAIVSKKTGLTMNGQKWTTKVSSGLFNLYPIYDWRTEDIWTFLGKNSSLPSNKVYSKMSLAGVPISSQRLCQPYGDDQKKGLWLYHILEPETWSRLILRVSGVNGGALYVQEHGNINGARSVSKPTDVSWMQYTNMLLRTMPAVTRKNYVVRFKKFIAGWKKRGYESIPDEVPNILEVKCWAPSWRRMARCILRNDFYCKGLGQTQPLSEAYLKYKEIKAKNRMLKSIEYPIVSTVNLFDKAEKDPEM
jgi:predicted phosphoadenosine phosphosulfate sulfurtransferase